MNNEKYKKIKGLPAQYSIYFSGIDDEVLYIIVSMNLHIGNDMDKGHYVFDVLYYNRRTWRNCDDDKITQYTGYPMNIYNGLSIDKIKRVKSVYGWIR